MSEDRDAAVVWEQEQRSRCKRCGTWEWEFDEDPEAWHADHGQCQGCWLLDDTEETLRNSKQSKQGTRTFLGRGP